MPSLRFPGFTGEWQSATLGEVCSSFDYGMNASAKEYDGENKYIRITDIEDQSNLYVPSPLVSPDAELEDKFLVCNNDILFARTGASVGKSYHYERKDGKLYFAGFLIKAHVKDEYNSRFIFVQTLTNRYKRWVKVMSARSGQPGINSDEYKSLPVCIPSKSEQKKIADFLSLLDERIATQRKIIKALESLMSATLQIAIRKGLENGSWRMTMLCDVLTERKETNSINADVFSVSVSQGLINQVEYLGRSFAAKDTSKYNVVRYGDVVYTKSPTGSFPFGIVKQSDIQNPVAVSPLYGVYKPTSYEVGIVLHHYFLSPINTKNYLSKLIQKGAKNTINITNSRFLENYVPLPISQKESTSTALLLDSLTKKLKLEEIMLDVLESQKQYFLSQMFI